MSAMQLRLAQLDLARQMETPQFICDFIDFAARCQYNGIMLYLEDRIRTASYPYPTAEESYSEEQIRSLLAYAEQKGIELFPCVSTLGHAERFLRHKPLQHLAELQGDMKGRFGGSHKDAFCPKHPEFYPFMEAYLHEVAALFPSPYFHAGLDEVWDFNLCPRCRADAADHLAETRLFLQHIERIHACLKKAGKRMLMWSDMFDNYRNIIQDLPPDIIMVDWQYQQDVRSYQGHLLDISEEDRIALNEKHGLETIIAPSVSSIGNLRSFIEYAENRKVLGCLVTSWEKKLSFYQRSLPNFAYAGFLMSGLSEEEAVQAMMQELFGAQDKLFEAGIKQGMTGGFRNHFAQLSESRLFSRNFFGLPYALMQTDEWLYHFLQHYLPQIKKEAGRQVCKDMLLSLRQKRLAQSLKKLFHDSLDRGLSAERRAGIKRIFVEIEQVLAELENEWEQKRPGIVPNSFTEIKAGLMEKLSKNLDSLEQCAFLRLRCCAPDQFIVQPVSIFLCCDSLWHKIFQENLKPDSSETALFERFIPFKPSLERPEALRFELSGLGGRGLCYAELRYPDGRVFVPEAVSAVGGIVEHPEHMLDNDVNWAWFGKQSSKEAFQSPALSALRHTLILSLKERRP